MFAEAALDEADGTAAMRPPSIPGSLGTGWAALWLAPTDVPLPACAATWLDEDERVALAAMRDAGERRRREVAWALRRWALTRARPDIDAAAWRFRRGSAGKPELAPPFDRFGLYHNLSHGGDFAAVLLAHAPCGIDVEAPSGGLEAAAVVFGPDERGSIAAHPRPEERFLQHWVAKEAALKLLGLGLGVAPEQMQLALAQDGRAAMRWPGDAALPPDLRIRLWPLPGRHWLAAALRGAPPAVEPAWALWHRD